MFTITASSVSVLGIGSPVTSSLLPSPSSFLNGLSSPSSVFSSEIV